MGNGKKTMLVSLPFIFPLLLFPPFYYDADGRIFRREWHIFFDSTLRGGARPGRLDVGMLMLELLLVGLALGAFYLVATAKKERAQS